MNMKTILMGAIALTCVAAFGGVLGSDGGVLGARKSMMRTTSKRMVANKLRECEFLLNKNYKKDAKVYLCFFSASWCPPCRAEMPRIAKTYAETLKDDPDIELIHFSRDQNDEKAMVMVLIGPACDMGISRLLAKSVGSQFFVAHPGRLSTAK